jgi:phosphonate degradation associated HDIG domain protein
MQDPLTDIHQLYLTKGRVAYDGEDVSQLEHALQTATMALQNDQKDAMIVACLLHDIGHLISNKPGDKLLTDQRHEYKALSFLQQFFGPEVTEPIRLHVEAKQYLCFADSNYWQDLSATSKLSLESQGGIFSANQAAQFLANPYAKDAIKLRHWDDRAKVVGLCTPDFETFTPYIKNLLISDKT